MRPESSGLHCQPAARPIRAEALEGGGGPRGAGPVQTMRDGRGRMRRIGSPGRSRTAGRAWGGTSATHARRWRLAGRALPSARHGPDAWTDVPVEQSVLEMAAPEQHRELKE
jgi:hypothetical protein